MGRMVLHARDITCRLCAGSVFDAVRAVPAVDAVSVGVVCGPSPLSWTQRLKAAQFIGSSEYGFDPAQVH
jgi:hypothetical protein